MFLLGKKKKSEAKIGNNPIQLAGELIKTLYSIHTMKSYSAIKKEATTDRYTHQHR